jgi:beta-N-acetylglucosaminidase
MIINKIIVFILVTSLLVMTLLATLTLIDLSERQIVTDKLLQENIVIKEKNDMLTQQLELTKTKEKELAKIVPTKTPTKAPTLANRSTINDKNISRPSGRTIEEINFILSGTKLANLGQAIIDAEKEYSVNGIFIISVAQLESGYGTSYLARTKNNLFGLNAWGNSSREITKNAYSYSTKDLCVQAFSRIIRENYLNKGKTTIKTISVNYCENSLSWYNKICILMDRNIKKINEFKEVKK